MGGGGYYFWLGADAEPSLRSDLLKAALFIGSDGGDLSCEDADRIAALLRHLADKL